MAKVELRDVRKTYAGGVEAVKGVSIAVPDGAMCVLVGPSGCGKSTLLRIVAGLETLTSGSVEIDGAAVDRLGPAERDIAMVFQNYALYPHMSVFDNMAYGLRNRGIRREEIEKRVREAAETLALSQLLERKPRELSGGQRQRVAMGRAIVRSPKAFLFDEPLSNLDAKLRSHMRVEIKNLQRRLGGTSIYVTHDQVEAMTLADILVVMNQGKAEQVGAPMEIYERPASVFVAGFIGAPAMNLLAATPAADRRGLEATAGGRISLDGQSLPDGLATGRPVLAGMRPEHLQPAEDGRAPDLEIVVTAIETLGADTLAHGLLAGSNGSGGELVVRLPGSRRVAEGETLPLVIAPGMLHYFDSTTQSRI